MKKCPHCQKEIFMVVIRKGAFANIQDNGDITILKEAPNFETEEKVICAGCKKEIMLEDLKNKVPCAICGEMHSPEVLVDGKCELCVLKEKLGSATKDDLYKVILELQHKVGPQGAKIEKKIEEANAAAEKPEESKDTKPPTTKRSRKKNTEENKETADVAPQDVPVASPAPAQEIPQAPTPTQAPAQATVNPVVEDVNDIFNQVPDSNSPTAGNPFDSIETAPEFTF